MTGSLAANNQSIHILYIIYIIHCILTIKYARKKKIIKYIYRTVFTDKNPYIGGPMQFKPELFKDQLYFPVPLHRVLGLCHVRPGGGGREWRAPQGAMAGASLQLRSLGPNSSLTPRDLEHRSKQCWPTRESRVSPVSGTVGGSEIGSHEPLAWQCPWTYPPATWLPEPWLGSRPGRAAHRQCIKHIYTVVRPSPPSTHTTPGIEVGKPNLYRH